MVRHLGVDDFGRYVTVNSLIFIVTGLTEGGLIAIGIREYSHARAPAAARLIRELLGMRIVLTLAASVAALAFGALAGYDDTMMLGIAFSCVGLALRWNDRGLRRSRSTRGSSSAGSRRSTSRARSGSTAVIVVLVVAGASLGPFFAANPILGAAAVDRGLAARAAACAAAAVLQRTGVVAAAAGFASLRRRAGRLGPLLPRRGDRLLDRRQRDRNRLLLPRLPHRGDRQRRALAARGRGVSGPQPRRARRRAAAAVRPRPHVPGLPAARLLGGDRDRPRSAVRGRGDRRHGLRAVGRGTRGARRRDDRHLFDRLLGTGAPHVAPARGAAGRQRLRLRARHRPRGLAGRARTVRSAPPSRRARPSFGWQPSMRSCSPGRGPTCGRARGTFLPSRSPRRSPSHRRCCSEPRRWCPRCWPRRCSSRPSR